MDVNGLNVLFFLKCTMVFTWHLVGKWYILFVIGMSLYTKGVQRRSRGAGVQQSKLHNYINFIIEKIILL